MIGIRELQAINVERAKRWHQSEKGLGEWSALEWAGAMAGEVGEAANAAKKLKRVESHIANLDARGLRSSVTEEQCVDYRAQIGKEAADAIIYGVLLAARVGCDIEDCIRTVFNAKSEEYGFPERV